MIYTSHSYRNPLYNTWKDMRKRCSASHRRDSKYYYDKGIRVCEEWDKSFKAFVRDMLPTYFAGATIDRLDNNEGYSKGNCKWSTRTEQQANRANVKKFWLQQTQMQEFYKAGKSQQEIAKIFGCSQGTISRILAGNCAQM